MTCVSVVCVAFSAVAGHHPGRPGGGGGRTHGPGCTEEGEGSCYQDLHPTSQLSPSSSSSYHTLCLLGSLLPFLSLSSSSLQFLSLLSLSLYLCPNCSEAYSIVIFQYTTFKVLVPLLSSVCVCVCICACRHISCRSLD